MPSKEICLILPICLVLYTASVRLFGLKESLTEMTVLMHSSESIRGLRAGHGISNAQGSLNEAYVNCKQLKRV